MKFFSKNGLKDTAVNWVCPYLSGSLKVTKVGGVKSPLLPVTCGVPQGSILGPLLFTVYINDLPLQIRKAKINLYADDSSITLSNANPELI